MTLTPEGYLTGLARVARIGVQDYLGTDGNVQREFRPPAEVFRSDSQQSFKNIPVVVNHPDEPLVTSVNAKALSVGFVGENINVDGEWLVMPITITDADAVKRVQGGMNQLSAGYTLDVVASPGVYMGEEYDAIQTSIRGNHVAIVEDARAGDMARLNLDSKTAIAITRKDAEEMTAPKKQTRKDADPSEPEKENEDANEEMKALKDENEKLKADLEELKGKMDAYKDMEEKENSEEEEKTDAADKIDLVLDAIAAGVKGDAKSLVKLDKRDIMAKTIAQLTGKEVKFDSKTSDVYIKGRYDALMDSISTRKDNLKSQVTTATPRQDGTEVETDPKAKARQDRKDALENQWKKDAK